MKTMQAGMQAQAASAAGRKPWFKSLRFQILALMLVCYLTPTLLLGNYLGGVFLTAQGGQPCLEERLPDGGTEVISLAEDAAPAEPGEEKALLFWDGQLLMYLDELFTVWE